MKHAPLLPLLLFGICVPEAVLSGADFQLWGRPGWRAEAYFLGALWPGLFWGQDPAYAGQTGLMLMSYLWLHSGLPHCLINGVALFVLGRNMARRVGAFTLLSVFLLSAIGSALIHAALTQDYLQPVVGASGGIFGLAGALMIWKVVEDRRLFGWFLLLIGAVSVLYLFLYKFVPLPSWNIHLGGALCGAMFAVCNPSGVRKE